MPQGQHWLHSLPKVLHCVEAWLLVSLFLTMLGVAVAQIVLRGLFDSGFSWGSELEPVLVLWVTMVGSTVAARRNGHIRIDVIGRFLKPKWNLIVLRTTNAAAALICFVLAWYATLFIYDEFVYQTLGIGVIPAWIFQLVIPLTAAIMGSRYVLQIFRPVPK